MQNRLEQELQAIVGAGNVRVDEPMGAHTTFRVGGPADFFAEPQSGGQLAQVAHACLEREVPAYMLGRGSNLLVADAGLRGVVVHIGSALGGIDVRSDGSVCAQAGAMNSAVAREVQNSGLSGFEFAAGIPGTIGGAAIMNAGAYGGEIAQVAMRVTCLVPESGEVRVLDRDQAQWGYRSSAIADAGFIVLELEMQLEEGDPDEIAACMADLARRRAEKQPLDLPSAGSTFKRPEGHFAGKLIQDAGMQGHAVGGAQVSEKHAGFVVNRGGATADDVRRVIDDVREAVFSQFNIELEPEVRMWGFGG